MSNSVGIDNIIKFLKNEKERFLNASKCGAFCDGEKCLKVSYVINDAIKEIDRSRENNKC